MSGAAASTPLLARNRARLSRISQTSSRYTSEHAECRRDPTIPLSLIVLSPPIGVRRVIMSLYRRYMCMRVDAKVMLVYRDILRSLFRLGVIEDNQFYSVCLRMDECWRAQDLDGYNRNKWPISAVGRW